MINPNLWEDCLITSYTFKTEWVTSDSHKISAVSTGRWGTPAEAAEHATAWMKNCAGIVIICSVEIMTVEELNFPDGGVV